MNVIPYTLPNQPAPPTADVPRDLVLDFGKRKGLPVSWVAEHDTNYGLWLMSQRFVRRRPQLWLCLRRHLARALLAQDAESVA